MKAYHEREGITVLHSDNLAAMAEMPDCSFDAIVTDPPYELGFMGKSWDATGIAYSVPLWQETLRLLKPGGYLLAFGGSRTYHRLACAIEDAGFVLHPLIGWLYGQGFPKATNLSKRFDAEAGAEREVVGEYLMPADSDAGNAGKPTLCRGDGGTFTSGGNVPITAPATPAARQWDGWFYGRQSLKPAIEPICMAQKPVKGRMTDNVLRWGTGAVNVAACRIGTSKDVPASPSGSRHKYNGGWRDQRGDKDVTHSTGMNPHIGRWPANLVLSHHPDCEQVGVKRVKGNGNPYHRLAADRDGQQGAVPIAPASSLPTTAYADPDGYETVEEWRCVDGCPVKALDEQSGTTQIGGNRRDNQGPHCGYNGGWTHGGSQRERDTGGASRFFFCAKASRADRGEGNDHPTVKPIALMRWLCRLITPPGGRVLDMFGGSGSTAVACLREGFGCTLIEQDEHNCQIAVSRLEREQAILPLEVVQC